MSKVRTSLVVTAVSATLLTGGAVAWAAYSWTEQSKVTVRSAGAVAPKVTVLGEVAGLLPGKTRPLQVTITNPNTFPVRVTKISGGNTRTPNGCPEWAVRIKPTGVTTVPAQMTRKLTVTVGMEQWADQKCAGQTFTFTLTTVMTAA
jgi:hypothetical protein